jgi:hypothetical protein
MSTNKKAFEDIEEIPCEDQPATEGLDEAVDEEESEDEDYEDDYEDEDEGYNSVDFGQLLSNFFVTENGENVAEALMGIKKSIDTHNKILLKYVNKK